MIWELVMKPMSHLEQNLRQKLHLAQELAEQLAQEREGRSWSRAMAQKVVRILLE